MKKKVIVIGAGPGGLAATLLLANAGIDVHVFEKSPKVGGRTKIIEKDGYKFDMGPTFFHYVEIIEQIFNAIGLDAHKELQLKKLDPNYRLVFGEGGGSIDCTSNFEIMSSRIREMFGDKEALAFKKYILDNRKKLKLSKDCLNEAWNSPRDIFSKRVLKAATILRPTRSVAEDLGKIFSDERLKIAMSFQTKYLGMSPYNCPSLFTILSFLEYEYGIYHPIGGIGSVTQKMYEIAKNLGAKFHLDCEVKKIVVEGNEAKGIETSKGNFFADALLLNADFAKAMTDLVEDKKRKKWTDKKLAKKKYSCSTFMLYLGLDRDYPNLPHHQIYTSKNHSRNLEDIENGRITWEDPSLYVQNACVTDKSLAPKGCSTVYVLVPVPYVRENINWNEIKEDYKKIILNQVEEKLGFENLQKHIKTEMINTPLDWANICYRGSIFNLAHGLDQMLWRRPRNRFGEIASMYLVGGGTHPGSGLPVIFQGAKISAKLILKDFGLSAAWG